MNAYALRLARAGLLAGPILLLTSCATSPQQDVGAVLARASQATGAAQVSTLRYTAEGTGYTFGQAYKAGGAWPKITLHSVTRSIDYGSGTMREEVVLSRAEPLGGGGYPLAGQKRNESFVSGELAWNVAGGNPAPAPRAVGDRMHQLWITPHGAIKAAMQGGRATVRTAEAGSNVVSFEVAGRLTAAATIGADGLPNRIDSVFPDPVLGDTAVTTTYDDWRDAGSGVKFPMRIRQSMGGYPVLDLMVKEVQVNPPLAMPVPDAARNTAERVTSEKVAEGVWFLAGGSHNSVLIELQDQLVLVETPLNDARTLAVIDHAKGLVPGKPIRTVINTHQHFDHAGGVRTAVAEGATIVTHADNVAYYERVLAQPNRIRPDAMARAGKKPLFRAVGDKLVIGDAARPIELHRTAGGPHSESLLMVYLPKERLLIEADSFTPPPPNTPPPAVANANNVNLVENLERLQLAVERLLPLHGRVVGVAELYGAVGRTAH